MTARRLLLPVFLMGAGVLMSGLRIGVAKPSHATIRRGAPDAVAASGTIAGEEDGHALHWTA
jgi:hypothetical protein